MNGNDGDTRALDPLNRRESGGQLRGFMPEFMQSRSAILAPLLSRIAGGAPFGPELFDDPQLAGFDERVIEYPFVAAALRDCAGTRKIQALDVGCVLNNPCIKSCVESHTAMIWFANESMERLEYSKNLGYILGDIRSLTLPDAMTFDFVSCLSTLEHVVMDNTRYGGRPAEFQGLCDDPERFACAALRRIGELVSPGGRLLVSVPFGPFEYLYVYGQPDRPIYYTFDHSRLERLTNSLSERFEISVTIYKVIPGRGWFPAERTDQNILGHADHCAAAGAVALIDAQRKPI
jgi:SAM-dependent methyltransferase